MVHAKREGNPCGSLTCIGGSRCRMVVRKTCAERREINLLRDVKIRKRLKEKVIELVVFAMPNLCGHFKNVFLWHVMKCVGKRGGGDTWWWSDEVEAISRKKDAYKVMCQNGVGWEQA